MRFAHIVPAYEAKRVKHLRSNQCRYQERRARSQGRLGGLTEVIPHAINAARGAPMVHSWKLWRGGMW